MNIAAVVVTFNRKKLLLECLNALKNQTYPLDAIFIIDGPSTDGTPEALFEYKYIKKLPPKSKNNYWETQNIIVSPINGKKIKIYYIRLYQDLGGSGGFYEGIKRAYEKGYDWIWLMDDDAEPKADALEKLIRYKNLPNAIALACLKVDSKGNILYHHRGYFYFENVFNHIVKPINEELYKNKNFLEIDHASFVGILINSKAIEEVGYPDRRFFIHYDDVEYCIRLRKVGKIYLIPDSVIIHKEDCRKKELIKKKFMGKIFYRIPFNKLWRSYYGIRNLTYLGKFYSENKWKFMYELLKHYIFSIGGIILFDDHKFRRIIFITSAYLDGLRGIFDNKKPKRILYEKKLF